MRRVWANFLWAVVLVHNFSIEIFYDINKIFLKCYVSCLSQESRFFVIIITRNIQRQRVNNEPEKWFMIYEMSL